ncbi:MAG TPA: flagellar basal-body rod protein FlgF [bacterium]
MSPLGIYSLVSRGKTLETQMEAVANNLANVDTVGYKQDQPAFKQILAKSMGVAKESDEELFATQDHLPPYSGVGVAYVATADMGKDVTTGRPTQTGKETDLALISSKGFFSIQTPAGERFTRAGSFILNSDRQLVTPDGYQVLGKEGPIVVKGNKFEVGQDGTITVDDKPAGGLKIVAFPYPERLQKLGGAMFAPQDAENNARILEDVQVAQGFVESSNVNAVKEMTAMIEANRAYTSMQKAITAADEMNQRALTLAQI